MHTSTVDPITHARIPKKFLGTKGPQNVVELAVIPRATIPPIPERQGPEEPEQLLSDPSQENRENSKSILNHSGIHEDHVQLEQMQEEGA